MANEQVANLLVPDLSLIVNYLNDNAPANGFIQATQIFADLESAIKFNGEVGAFKAAFSSACTLGWIAGIQGVRGRGYKRVAKDVVLKRECSTDAPPDTVRTMPKNEPAKAPEPKNEPVQAPIQTAPIPEVLPKNIENLTRETILWRGRIRYLWIGQECYSYIQRDNLLIELIQKVCSGAESADGNVVVSGKRYSCNETLFRAVLRITEFGTKFEGHFEPMVLPDLLVNPKEFVAVAS